MFGFWLLWLFAAFAALARSASVCSASPATPPASSAVGVFGFFGGFMVVVGKHLHLCLSWFSEKPPLNCVLSFFPTSTKAC